VVVRIGRGERALGGVEEDLALPPPRERPQKRPQAYHSIIRRGGARLRGQPQKTKGRWNGYDFTAAAVRERKRKSIREGRCAAERKERTVWFGRKPRGR